MIRNGQDVWLWFSKENRAEHYRLGVAVILNRRFPGRTVVPLNCTDVIWGLGAFHCLTQQVPAGTAASAGRRRARAGTRRAASHATD